MAVFKIWDGSVWIPAAGFNTVSHIIYIEDPAADDSWPIGYVKNAATIMQVVALVDTSSVTFNIETRGQKTADDAGTDIFSSDKVATTVGGVFTVIDSPAIAADSWLHYAASAIGGTSTKLWISVTRIID